MTQHIFHIYNQTSYRLPRQLIQKVLQLSSLYLNLPEAELSIVFVTPPQIRRLNYQYRGKNQATDVLSFCYEFNHNRLEGEIIICYQLAAKQAVQYGHTVKEEITKLLVHSLLHLIGYDHQTVAQAQRMKTLEDKIIHYLKAKKI